MAPAQGPTAQRLDPADEFERLLAARNDGAGDPPRRHGRAKRKRRRVWPWLLGMLLVLLLLAGSAFWFAYQTYPEQVKSLFGWSNDYTGGGAGRVDVVVKPGDSGSTIADTLLAKDVTKTRSAFYDLLLSKKPEPSVEAGTYRLRSHMSAASALRALEDPANRQQSVVLLPEGLTAAQILDRTAKATGLKLADLQAATKDRAALGLPKGARSIEGWLFPATYVYQPGVTAQKAVQGMVDRTKKALDDAGVAEGDRERVLTMAGLVQKEGNGEDDAKVARVFLNRIEAKMPLQSDATVSYGAGGTTVVPTSKQYKDRNPYNTYLRLGLPAGPISSPGDEAIDAAVHPAKGPWLFFVTVNLKTGETVFSKTLEEHDRAAAQFTRWLKAHPDYAK